MDIRQANPDDISGIRSVARASLTESYGHALDDDIIDSVVERWYDADDIASDFEDEATHFVVAVDDGEVMGFAQSYVTSRREVIGEIDWLHVDPAHRGKGLGSKLLRALEEELVESGVSRVEGSVLAANEMGTEFYEDHDFTAAGERTVVIGGKEFRERVYVKFPDVVTEFPGLKERTVGDRTVYVARDETVRGSMGVFYATYMDKDREERYGWTCSCGNVGVVMDTMERLECGDCGNRSKATRWDAAYL